MNDYELTAKYTYEAHQKSLDIKDEMPWEQLGDKEKMRWRDIAAAAVQAYPGPLSGEVRIITPGAGQHIVRFYRSDTTKESIHAACVDLEGWLLEISSSWRPPEPIREDRSQGKFKDAAQPREE